jgi:membrane-bound serine protease (ClpP class)
MPGAIMGLFGAAAVVGGIWIALQHNTALGIGEIGLAVVLIPTFIVWGIRRMQLKATIKDPEPEEDLSVLVGKMGEVLTDLKPSGTVLLEGERRTASSMGKFLDKGTKVSVVKVEGKNIFVRAV